MAERRTDTESAPDAPSHQRAIPKTNAAGDMDSSSGGRSSDLPAAAAATVLTAAPRGRSEQQRWRRHERSRQPGDESGTGHAASPGQQFAVIPLAHGDKQPAPGAVEREPGPGPRRKLEARHYVEAARIEVKDRNVGWEGRPDRPAGILSGPRELEGGRCPVGTEDSIRDWYAPGRQHEGGRSHAGSSSRCFAVRSAHRLSPAPGSGGGSPAQRGRSRLSGSPGQPSAAAHRNSSRSVQQYWPGPHLGCQALPARL